METQYDSTKIVRVYHTYSTEDANNFLKLGWVMLSVLTIDRGNPGEINQDVKYVLGWDRNAGDIQVPKDDLELPF